MSKGILYCMTTVVPGLIKIGQTGKENFESRMYTLERNGYNNVVGLKRKFAIEVEDYIEKEKLLDTIFSKSQVPNSELFALDIDLVVQLLSSFEGTVIYPPQETKAEAFEEATELVHSSMIPDGLYYLKRRKKNEGNREIKATVKIENGQWILLKGSDISMIEAKGMSDGSHATRKELCIDNGILKEDYFLGECTPSHAASVVLFQSANGWAEWKDKDNNPIDVFRNKEVSNA